MSEFIPPDNNWEEIGIKMQVQLITNLITFFEKQANILKEVTMWIDKKQKQL